MWVLAYEGKLDVHPRVGVQPGDPKRKTEVAPAVTPTLAHHHVLSPHGLSRGDSYYFNQRL